MSSQTLFVPVEEEGLFLYEVKVNAAADTVNTWWINGIPLPRMLKETAAVYFDKPIHPAEISFTNSGKRPKWPLDDSTKSVYLGLFIAMLQYARRRTFKPEWDSITVTGDIAIHEGTVEPAGVTHIKEKHAGVQNYAKEHEKENHLFLYVSDEQPVKPGWDGNLEVKAFTPQDSIGAIIAELFEPAFHREQKKFFDRIPVALEAWDYVSTNVFEEMKRNALSKKWTGFLIHGEGESGKSAMALELAKYLAAAERIYAPIWVRTEENELHERFPAKKELRSPPSETLTSSIQPDHIVCFGSSVSSISLGQKKEKSENPVTDYIAGLIAEALNHAWTPQDGLSALANALEREGSPYLLIIDNLEVNEIDEVWKSVQAVVGKCSPRPPVVFTSRIEAKITGLTPVRPSELTAGEIEKLVENIAQKQGQAYTQELLNWKDKQEYDEFITHLHANFASFPGIITVIVPQLDRGLPAVLQTLDNLNLLDKDVNEKAEAIYTTVFSHLDSFTQVVLFLFIRFTLPWIGDSFFDRTLTQKICQILSELEASDVQFDGIGHTPEKIEEKTYQALDELARIHILNRDPAGAADRPGKNEYYIKTLPIKILTSSESIANAIIPVTDKKCPYALLEGEWLRVASIAPEELIRICIYYHQSGKRLETLLTKYYVDYLHSDYYLFTWAAAFSKKPEHIKAFYDHGYKEIDREFILHKAACNNQNEKVIQQLLDYGAKVSIKDAKGDTPLHCAAQYNPNPNIISLLHSREPEALPIRNNYGYLPIHLAAMNKNPDVFKRFVKLDPHLLDYDDTYGNMPLFDFIRYCNDPNIVSWLEENKIDLNLTNPANGATLLHYAAMNSKLDLMHEDMITILKGKRLNINATDLNGYTPLHWAAQYNTSINSIRILLINGADADINAKNKAYLTPLMCAAAENENPEIPIALINAGADLYAQDNDGKTAISYLKERKDWSVIKKASEMVRH